MALETWGDMAPYDIEILTSYSLYLAMLITLCNRKNLIDPTNPTY